MLEALIEAALGVFFTLLVFGGMFWISWLVLTFYVVGLGRATPYALGVTGLFAVVSVVSAWRRVNPLANLRKLSEFEESMVMLGPMLPYGIGMQPRHASAGFATLLIGGPANLFDAWSTWRHRLPAGGQMIAAAGEVLQQAKREVRPQDVIDPLAAMVLHRLGLVKMIHQGEKRIALTEKGRALLAGA